MNEAGKSRRRYLWLLLLAAPVLYFAACESFYRAHMRPDGVATFHDYCLRFGDPFHMTSFLNEGKLYYEVRGEMPPAVITVFPSSLPSYVFDAEGSLADWCLDPDDSAGYREKWPNRNASKEADVAEMKRLWGY